MDFVELRKVDVDVVTFGQYMRPTKRHMKVDRYVEPAEFDRWKQVAEDMGFLYVASGPLVRSSYKVCRHFLLCTHTIPTKVPCYTRPESTSLRMFSEAKVPRRRRRSCSCRTVFWPRLRPPLDADGHLTTLTIFV